MPIQISCDAFAEWTQTVHKTHPDSFMLTLSYSNAATIAYAGTMLKRSLGHFWRHAIGNNFRRAKIINEVRFIAFLDAPSISFQNNTPQSTNWHHHLIIQTTTSIAKKMRDRGSMYQSRANSYYYPALNDEQSLYSHMLDWLPANDDLYRATMYAAKNTQLLIKYTEDAYLLPKSGSLQTSSYEKLPFRSSTTSLPAAFRI